MSDCDLLHRFLFNNSDIRGEIITLQDSYQQVLAKSDHPPQLANLMGEFLAAAGLLAATLKSDGIITLQARGDGPVQLLMADCSYQHTVRAVSQATEHADLSSNDIRELLGQNGHLNIIIDSSKGERYQGIVPLDQATLSGCLETYFSQSEQISTRVWLCSDGQKAGGLMIQALPEQKAKNSATAKVQWDHITTLTETLTPEEQLNLNHNDQLYRLFHQEDLRLFDPEKMHFACSCSRTRTENMLRTIGRDEVQQILEDQGAVEINCHFCHQKYLFSTSEIKTLFDGEQATIH
jgi:molecular chaperone Hsp33